MTVAKSSIAYWVSIDCDKDVSGDTLIVTVDPTQPEVSWVTAVANTPSAAIVAEKLAEKPITTGFTRYWWRFYSGSNTGQVPLQLGMNKVHGKLTDTPQIPYQRWNVYAHLE